MRLMTGSCSLFRSRRMNSRKSNSAIYGIVDNINRLLRDFESVFYSAPEGVGF